MSISSRSKAEQACHVATLFEKMVPSRNLINSTSLNEYRAGAWRFEWSRCCLNCFISSRANAKFGVRELLSASKDGWSSVRYTVFPASDFRMAVESYDNIDQNGRSRAPVYRRWWSSSSSCAVLPAPSSWNSEAQSKDNQLLMWGWRSETWILANRFNGPITPPRTNNLETIPKKQVGRH